MYFGNFRDCSVKLGKYKKLRVPSEKCMVLSVSGLQLFIISDFYRDLAEITEMHYTPVTMYVKMTIDMNGLEQIKTLYKTRVYERISCSIKPSSSAEEDFFFFMGFTAL